MGAYNRVNGDPCCAHPYLMQEVLRKKWGFKGYFVSDCWAIVDFYQGHKVVKTAAEAAALAINTGCNLNCGSTYPELVSSVKQGLTTEAEIDANLRELLPTRFKLGLFDPPGSVPFDTIGPSWIRKKEHVDLSLEAAEKSLVLLKNAGNLLPLDPAIGSVFITGPTAAHIQSLLANYYGVSEDLKTMLEGIIANLSPHTLVRYVQGSLLDEPNRNPVDWYSSEASEAEVTIACMGISQLIEGEEGESIMSRHLGDREEIGLPQNQIDFLKLIRSKAKKLIVVITGGSAMTIPEVYDMADALIYAWYPGEQGGLAVGNTIFGKSVPSGKLPVTFPKSVDDLPPYEDYALSNRTYRYITKEPLFPFGFGLSYSSFNYSDLTISQSTQTADKTFKVICTVTNSGQFEADEVVQLYVSDLEASVPVPQFALKGFQRISLKPGESKTITFDIGQKELELVNNDGERKLEPGDFQISIGGSVPSQRSLQLGAPQYQQAVLTIK
jgi:beta-glucosidase